VNPKAKRMAASTATTNQSGMCRVKWEILKQWTKVHGPKENASNQGRGTVSFNIKRRERQGVVGKCKMKRHGKSDNLWKTL